MTLMAQTAAGQAAAPGSGVVAELARRLEQDYVVRDVAPRYAAMLRGNLATGAYDALDTEALAVRLTGDLRAVSPDNHLRIVPIEQLPRGTSVAPLGGAAPAAAEPPRVETRNGPRRPPAVQDAGWIAPGVAYLRYTSFMGGADAVVQTATFMRDHAAARALIIDCRYNGGGGMGEMNVILPYLYGRETPLVTMDVAESLVSTQGMPFEGPMIRRVAGPAGTVRTVHVAIPRQDETRLFDVPVFYLVSPGTASAAEHLALAFKRTKRAVLIGATTAGANHFGDYQAIGGGLAVFLPVGRTFDQDTGKDWEATGIAPDVAVAPITALEEALRRARVLAAT